MRIVTNRAVDVIRPVVFGFVVSILAASATAREDDVFSVDDPNTEDWSEKRISNLRQYQNPGTAIGVLSISERGIEALIYKDTVHMALEAGVTSISGTAAPGEEGNVVIAGHRDSFFRKLEGIPGGSRIQVVSESGTTEYEVEQVAIVDALDTTPLEPGDSNILTLITCHPFRYQGFAPDRYIVRATLVEDGYTADTN